MKGEKPKPEPFLHPKEQPSLRRQGPLPEEEGLSDPCSFPVTSGHLVATMLSLTPRALLLVPALPAKWAKTGEPSGDWGVDRCTPLISGISQVCAITPLCHPVAVSTCHPKSMASEDNTCRKLV